MQALHLRERSWEGASLVLKTISSLHDTELLNLVKHMWLWFYFSSASCEILIIFGFLEELSTIYNSKTRRMEGQTKRYRGVDEAPSTATRTTRTCSSVCSIQMDFHQRCRWRIHLALVTFGHSAWYSKTSMSGPCSPCKFFCIIFSASNNGFEEKYVTSSWNFIGH